MAASVPVVEKGAAGPGAHVLAGAGAECRRIAAVAVSRHRMLVTAVGGDDEAGEPDQVAFADGITADRRAAGAVERGEEGTFAGDGVESRAIVNWRQQIVDPRIADAAFDADRSLRRRRREGIGIEDIGQHVDLAETLQAGKRQQGGINLALFELAQAGFDQAAEGDDVDVRPHAADQRLAAERG